MSGGENLNSVEELCKPLVAVYKRMADVVEAFGSMDEATTNPVAFFTEEKVQELEEAVLRVRFEVEGALIVLRKVKEDGAY